MHQEHILIGCGLRGYEIRGIGDSSFKQTVTNPAIFLGGKYVRADWKIIVVAIDQLEREHGGFTIEFRVIRLAAGVEDAAIIVQGSMLQKKHAPATERQSSLVGGRRRGLRDVGFASFAPPFDNQVEHWNEEEIQNGRHDHAAEDRGPNRVAAFLTSAMGHH